MSIREKPIYLSNEVHRALWIVAQVTDSKQDGAGIRTATPDEIADDILRLTLRERFPTIFDHLVQVDKARKELIKSLAK